MGEYRENSTNKEWTKYFIPASALFLFIPHSRSFINSGTPLKQLLRACAGISPEMTGDQRVIEQDQQQTCSQGCGIEHQSILKRDPDILQVFI